MRYLISITIAFTLISCARQKQVWLGELQRGNAADKENVTRAYFDRYGDLYPNNGIVITYKDFFDPTHSDNTYKENNETGNLEYYFCQNNNALNELVKSYSVSITNNCKQTFALVQEKINESICKKINSELGNDGELIVFIHGFNDPNPTGDFQQMRDLIKKQFPQRKISYLEVFWDGLTCNQGNPALAGIWGRAQKNSSNVAIGLRMLISKINNVPIKIITHSLGASVATGALFNTNSKWNNDNKEYLELSQLTEAPNQDDVRLGMLAPAIPGVTTFRDFNKRGKANASTERININRIVIGYNKNDLAVTKRAGKKDNSGIAGATNLGCDYKDEIKKTIDELTLLKYSSEQLSQMIKPINFTIDSTKVKEEHGMYYYMLNEAKIKEFINVLFN